MKTLTEVLKEIRDKADRDIAEATFRYSLYDYILTKEVDGFCIPHIHIHNLWGTLGAVRWEAARTDGTLLPPSQYLLRTLLKRFRPERLVHVKSNGTASFRPDTQTWDGETTLIHPVTVTVESLPVVGRKTREVRVSFNWNADIGGSLLRFSVVFPEHLVNLTKLEGARIIQWANTTTQTFWWEPNKRVPDFSALITETDALDALLASS